MMKRIVYIGDYAGKTIYFDTKKKVILKTKSNPMLDSDKTKNTTKWVLVLIFGLGLIQPLLRKILLGLNVIDMTVSIVPFFVLLGYFFVVIGLSWLVYFALYSNSQELELATQQEFRRAVSNNNLGQFMKVNASSKKFLGAKVKSAFCIVGVLLAAIVTLVIPMSVFEQTLSITEVISGIMAGMGPAAGFIIVWVNNPLRWVIIVERFAKNKIKWGAEAVAYEKELRKKKKEAKNGK